MKNWRVNENREKKNAEKKAQSSLLVKSTSFNAFKYYSKISRKIEEKNLTIIFGYFIENSRSVLYIDEKFDS